MDLKSYTNIILAAILVPVIVVPIVGCIVWYRFAEGESFILLLMKGIISKKNIDRRPTYLVCNRKLDLPNRRHFVIVSLSIFLICVHVFFLVSVVDVSYECINDPNLDCFKKKDDIKLSDTYAYDELPVNCSTVSREDFVICYRKTVLDPEKAFAGAATAYLLFKIINFGLIVVAYTMLWMAQKLQNVTMKYVKFVVAIIILFLFVTLLILRLYVDDVETAFRKMSFTVVVQFAYLLVVLMYFIAFLPWEEIDDSEYYEDVSLPGNVAARANEIS